MADRPGRGSVCTSAPTRTGPVVATDPRGDFAEQTTLGWLNQRDSTKARNDSDLNSLILPAFANMSLGAVHPIDIQQWVAQLDTDGYAPATIRKAYQLLERIFSDAVQAGLIIRSPCHNITLPRVEGSEMRFLSPDEIGHLASTIEPRYRAMVLTAAYTGCRFGEIAALDLDNYDLDRRIGKPPLTGGFSWWRYWDRTSDLCRVKVSEGVFARLAGRTVSQESPGQGFFLVARHLSSLRKGFRHLVHAMWTRLDQVG